jgi:hypothetical protein
VDGKRVPHRLATSTRLRQGLGLLEQGERARDIAADACDGGELRLRKALELGPSGAARKLEHRLGVTGGALAVAEPPVDRRDQRVSVVEAGQLVGRQGRERLVGEIMRPRDVGFRMQREIREQHERSPFDIAATCCPSFGQHLLGLVADCRNVGKAPRGVSG